MKVGKAQFWQFFRDVRFHRFRGAWAKINKSDFDLKVLLETDVVQFVGFVFETVFKKRIRRNRIQLRSRRHQGPVRVEGVLENSGLKVFTGTGFDQLILLTGSRLETTFLDDRVRRVEERRRLEAELVEVRVERGHRLTGKFRRKRVAGFCFRWKNAGTK